MNNKLSSRAEKQALLAARRRYGLDNFPQPSHPARQAGRPARLSGRPASPVDRPLSLPKPSKRKRSWLRRALTIMLLAFVVSGGVFGYRIIAAGDNISTADRSILGQLKDLLFSQGSFLAGESDDRVNVLLIGIGGKGHKGEDLADTIMVISYQPSTGTAALLSLPRDLYVQAPGQEYYNKINAVHAFGESQKKGQGAELLRQLVEEMTSLPLHYYVRVDFIAFKNIIDALGGINITIDHSFYDYWHKISFPAGTEKMNGERALAYVRARYSEGSEGGDFKRAARQQQVLLALHDKVFSVQTALDFTGINTILNSLSDNIRTDMQLWEMKRFYELARLIDQTKIHSAVLATGPQGVLTGSTEILGGAPASVLRPRTGDYSEIRSIAQNILTTAPETPAPTSRPADEAGLPADEAGLPAGEVGPSPSPALKPSLVIRNGTNITGLARHTADKLEEDYTIAAIGNAAQRGQTQTIIYILSPDHAPGAAALANTFGWKIENDLPENEPPVNADALVILGADAQ